MRQNILGNEFRIIVEKVIPGNRKRGELEAHRVVGSTKTRSVQRQSHRIIIGIRGWRGIETGVHQVKGIAKPGSGCRHAEIAAGEQVEDFAGCQIAAQLNDSHLVEPVLDHIQGRTAQQQPVAIRDAPAAQVNAAGNAGRWIDAVQLTRVGFDHDEGASIREGSMPLALKPAV